MAVADGFHVDSVGNHWIGSNRETFDATTRSEAPFYVYANGDLVANSGTFAGDLSAAGGTFSGNLSAAGGTFSGDISGASGTFTGDLSGADISGGTIDIGSGTFQVSSAGAVTASNLTITGGSLNYNSNTFGVTSAGVLTATSGTIGGWTIGSTDLSAGNISIDSTGSISGNYTAGSAGWLIEADGDAYFNKVDIRIGSAVSQNPSTGFTTLDIGTAKLSEYNDDLWVSAERVMIYDSDATASANSPSLFLFAAYGQPGWYVDDSQIGRTKLYYSNGVNNVFHTESDNTYLHLDGSGIQVGTATGGNSQYIGKNSSGSFGWHNLPTGNTHPDSDHTSFITQSDADTRYVNESDHTHSNLVGDTAFNNHANSSTAHGTFDNYSYWTLRGNPGGNLQTANVGSTGTASIYAGTSMSASMSGSSITLNNTGVTSIGQSGNDGFVTAVSGSTVTTSRDLGTATIETGHHLANLYGAALGSSSFGDRWYRLYAHNASDTSSDERLKENIIDINYGLDFINDLRPVEFEWKDITEYHCEEHSEEKYSQPRDYCFSCKKENDIIYMDYLKEKELFDNDLIEEEPVEPTFTPCVMIESTKDINNGKKTWGLIAQEVETVLGDYQNNVVSHDTDEDTYGLAYETIISPLIKAVQELSAKNDELESRLAALEG